MISMSSLVHEELPSFPSLAMRPANDHVACAHFLSALSNPFTGPTGSATFPSVQPKKGDVSWLLNEDKEQTSDARPWFQPSGPQCKREQVFGAVSCSRSPSPGAHPVAPQMSPPLSHSSKAPCGEAAHGPMGPRASSACASSADEDHDGKKQWTISLDAELAAYIYQIRPRNAGSRYGSMAEAARIGTMHGVSPKTIRDIWNRKSWVKATRKLWTAEEASSFVPRRHRRSSGADADTRDKKRQRTETE
mmetsp:Transcript_27624/g.55552  ORF Transcript_27624/g.55552 Transcript_27624/m.55552 type:complete len:248 (+) Transcript_27624:198-941(+)